ncbi:MAG: HAD family hydrolase [bacterium]|jgi:phosphatidylglycerophosphatase C
MHNHRRVAIFDFDDTLFRGQSHSYFISFLESKLPPLKFFYTKLRKRFEPKAINDRLHKEYLLKPFKGYSEEWIDKIAFDFYNDVIRRRLKKKVLNEFSKHKSVGDKLIIASGGFDVYLKYFELEFQPEILICTKLEFRNGIFTGKFKGEEVLSENKALQVKLELSEEIIAWQDSYVYSDHISDLPLFNLVGNRIVVDIGQDKNWLAADYKVI